MADFEGSRFVRLKALKQHLANGRLDEHLFWSRARAAAS